MKSRIINSVLIILLGCCSLAVAQKRPVTVTSVITPPYTVYLDDYAEKWKVNLVFGDLNESSWNVAIKVKITSDKFSAQTDLNFNNGGPIVLNTGVPYQLSYQDLRTYLDPSSLVVSGSGTELFRQQGRLPEGFYTFCVQVIDYTSGVAISHESCVSTWILLNDPPRVINPLCGAYIKPSNPQNFNFLWQLVSTSPSMQLGAEYQITIQEMIDKKGDPRSAINNGNTFPIFQSPWQTASSFHYGVSEPRLDVGEIYIYQIQARDRGGKDAFKNDGFSEVCWFYYGYPEGANIKLTRPSSQYHFAYYDRQKFSWEAPDLRIHGQPFNYKMEIVEIEEGQDSLTAIENNEPWHVVESNIAYSLTGYSFDLIDKKLEPMTWYAWQVKTYSDVQLVAQSEIRTFQGPPVVEDFYVRNHLVKVISTDNSDINDLSGTGRLSIGYGDTVTVNFKHIKLEHRWDHHILKDGNIYYTFKEKIKKELLPQDDETLKGNLALTKLRLNKEGLYIQGIVEYPLIHPTTKRDAAYVISDTSWFYYDSYKLSGRADVKKNQSYDLLEPNGFTMSIHKDSYFLLQDENYWVSFYGDVYLPLNRKSKQGKRVGFHFLNQKQLFYFNQLQVDYEASWNLIDKTNLQLEITTCTIDLSEEKSPDLLIDNPLWKGAYFNESTISSSTYIDKRGQISLEKDLNKRIVLTANSSNKSWLDDGGLRLYAKLNAGKGRFNQFPTVFDNVVIDIKNDAVQNSDVKGKIVVPVLSEQEEFSYTVPLGNNGFSEGYLDRTLENRSFVFNKEAGDQRINLHIDRAVFANQSKLVMMVDLEWPSAGVKMNNVSGFSVWGADYNIGFAAPNGAVSLTHQVKGSVSNYPITLDHIGAGRQGGLYSFGSTGQIVMGEGFTGPDGPTEVNFYSIGQNNLLNPNISSPVSVVGGLPADQLFSTQALNSKAEQKLGMALSNNGKSISFGENFQANLKLEGAGDFDLNKLAGGNISVGEYDIDVNNLSVETFSLMALQKLMGELKTYLPEEKQAEALEVINYLPKLKVEHQKRLYKELINLKGIALSMLQSELDKMLVELTGPLEEVIAEVQGEINGQIDSALNDGYAFIDAQLTILIDGVASQAAAMAKSQGFEVDGEINTVKASVHKAVYNELTSALDVAIRKNLLSPFDVVLKENLVTKLRIKLSADLMQVGMGVLDPNTSNARLDDVMGGFGDFFTDIGSDLASQFSGENLQKMVKGFGADLIAELDVESIAKQIATDLLKVAGQAIVEKYVTENVEALTEELGGEVMGNLAANVDLDFSNLGDKLKSGRIDKIIKFDPSNIKITTAVADIQGTIKFEKDDPQFGDVWIGELKAAVKIMPSFSCGAKFMNGRKDGYGFWFFSLEVRDLNLPMAPLPFLFDGANGKIYHHMQARGDVVGLNKDVKFGANLTMFFKDSPMTGSIVDFNVGVSLEFLDGGFYMGMTGDVNVGNFGGFSLMNGHGEISYNSKEKHFLGTFAVKSNTEALGVMCVGGGLDIQVRPNYWQFAIGTRDDPISAEPLCGPVPSFKSWFSLNKTQLDAGLYVRAGINAEPPFWINLIIVKVKPYANFELMAGAEIVIGWDPLKLRYASLEAGISAAIGVKWRTPRICVFGLCTPSASGDLTIVGVWLHGKLSVAMEEKFKMDGQLDGRVVFWNKGFNFDLDVHAEL